MEQRTIPVTTETFRSPLIPAAAGTSAAASLLGLLAVAQLFSPGALSQLTEDLVLSGIADPSALATWQIIHICLTVAAFLFPALTAASLILVLVGRIGKGTDLMYQLSQWTLRLVKISGILALVLLIGRTLLYVIQCLMVDGGIYFLYSMLLSEALMAVQAWILYTQLVRFLSSLSDSALSIGCTMTSGVLDNVSIPGFTSTGFGILAIFSAFTAADRLLTVTIVQSYPNDYYKLLTAEHPILLLSGGALVLAAVANVLLWLYLRHYKRISERLMYAAKRIRE